MNSEQQYIELYEQARQMIFGHATESMNAVRDQAFEDFVTSVELEKENTQPAEIKIYLHDLAHTDGEDLIFVKK